jgi:NADPH2:quinone reductase
VEIMSASPTVTAARLKQHGEPLEFETVALPEPNADDVLVHLSYGAVNPVDRYIAAGRVAPEAPLPRTLGGEAAGTLDGRPVVVSGEGLGVARDGVWASAAVVPRAAVVSVPNGVELQHAAAVGVVGVTAWNVVREVARVTPEDRVLVLGASGGVGSAVVSLVHSIGATVWGQTGSESKAATIEQDGADRVIVAGPGELTAAVSELEPTVVVDPLGGEFLTPVLDALAPHGRLVVFGTSAGAEVQCNLQTLYRKSIALRGYAGLTLTRAQRRAGVEAALGALRDGAMRLRIDDTLALDEVNEAFDRLATRKVSGKLLLALSN